MKVGQQLSVLLSFSNKQPLVNRAKRKNMCVSCYISKKNRVGRSLLIFFYFKFLFFIFPNFTKKHNKCAVFMKYITKRGLFGAIY